MSFDTFLGFFVCEGLRHIWDSSVKFWLAAMDLVQENTILDGCSSALQHCDAMSEWDWDDLDISNAVGMDEFSSLGLDL